jgi:hypothetical protein
MHATVSSENTPPNTPPPEVLGWRFAEFCKIVPVSRALLQRMVKDGELRVIYMGDVPIITRIEAKRLGLLAI